VLGGEVAKCVRRRDGSRVDTVFSFYYAFCIILTDKRRDQFFLTEVVVNFYLMNIQGRVLYSLCVTLSFYVQEMAN
jgi:hypothetical protein